MRRTVGLFLLLGIWPSHLSATPVQWSIADGGNGHSYDLVIGTKTWPQAEAAAEALVFHGVPGYLATITSQAESDFMRTHLPTNRYWIGGFQDLTAPDYSEPAGGWRWVTGEPFVYTHWNVGEPNNDQGDERYLEVTGFPDWSWNDMPQGFFHGAFYVEYPTPEPSTFALAGVGVASLALIARGSRRRNSASDRRTISN